MQVIERAQIFATAAHKAIAHKRKYTGACYTVHLREVAELVEQSGGSEAMIAAAWLHDVVEDTAITQQDIAEQFSADIADLVFWLTDVSKSEDGNRKLRKAKDRAHLAQAPQDAQAIKACDLISNARDICEHDKNFARVFLNEKRALLDAMKLIPTSLRAKAEHTLAQCAEQVS